MIPKKKIRNILLLTLFVTFTTIFIFREPIKVFIRNNTPEVAYLRLSWLKNIITGSDFGFYKYDIRLADMFYDINKFIVDEQLDFSIKLRKNNNLNLFPIPPFFPGIGNDEVNTSYIDFHNDDLIYTTKNGIFFNVTIDEGFAHFKPLKTNISDFLNIRLEEKHATINYFNPYTQSKLGIKDIFIDNNILYVSFIESNNQKGYNTSIIKAEISEYLNFTKLYTPRNFITSTNREFYPVSSGGRIVNFKQDSLLFSIGDYRDRTSAQDINSDNGKIIAINKNNGGSRIVSLGHRNPQGLDYSKKFDYIISSEHGPAGGDEINLNTDTNFVKNFGWPISSYGIHYAEIASRTDSHGGDPNRVVKNAPLYKNHSNYGFIEPLIYWETNPAVSELRIVKEYKNNGEFIVSTLGNDTINRPYTHHLLHYKFDIDNNNAELLRKISVKERVRDITYNKSSNRIYYIGESTGVLGFINLEFD